MNSATILSAVKIFCVVAPRRTPRQFRRVSPAIDRMAITRIAGSVSGTKNPMYRANPTAIAAMEAVLMTAKFAQP